MKTMQMFEKSMQKYENYGKVSSLVHMYGKIWKCVQQYSKVCKFMQKCNVWNTMFNVMAM